MSGSGSTKFVRVNVRVDALLAPTRPTATNANWARRIIRSINRLREIPTLRGCISRAPCHLHSRLIINFPELWHRLLKNDEVV